MVPATEVLCFAGVLLFLLGLLNGFAIPVSRSPRLGLSAHLTAVQSGAFLLGLGLLWPKLGIDAAGWGGALADAIAASCYMIWLSLLLAGIFGAGRGLPIAGQGITTTAAKQTAVTVLMAIGSLALVAAMAGLLITWRWQG
ncbi:MAG TPA: hypothetical protein VKS60_02795 [Stellaceae bacterium]|jgi:hydroxylaminobenzene mutase|nr:hypothetical protein [Stellaceae bacterium]